MKHAEARQLGEALKEALERLRRLAKEERARRGPDAEALEIAIVNLDGQYYAISDICSHAHCNLSDGSIEDGRVWCPCHGSEFDVRTGAVVGGPAQEGVTAYPVRIEGQDILIEL